MDEQISYICSTCGEEWIEAEFGAKCPKCKQGFIVYNTDKFMDDICEPDGFDFNALPVQEMNLSFHDLDTNELALIDLQIGTEDAVPIDYYTQMTERFLHTFFDSDSLVIE